MHFDRVASLLVMQPLLRAGLRRPKPAIPILMYHSISEDPEPGVSPYYRLTTSPARFRDQMQWLHEGGYATIDLADALGRLEAKSPSTERCVVLTFDDGFLDFLDHGWPTLSAFGFTATMFLPAAFIGDSRKSFKGRECLTWSETRTLHSHGVSFGSHTMTHPTLYGLPWPDIRRELGDSRLLIEQELQAPVRTFAYPYAFPQEDRDFADRFRGELVAQGYHLAVTTMIGRAQRGQDRLSAKRLPVNGCDDKSLFMGKLTGAYDWLAGPQYVSRYAASRARALKSAWKTI